MSLRHPIHRFIHYSTSVLQCVAVCCSVLQCVAVRCSVVQCVAVHDSTNTRYGTGALQKRPIRETYQKDLYIRKETVKETCIWMLFDESVG